MNRAKAVKNKKRKDRGHIVTISPILIWMLLLVAAPLIIVFIMGFLTRGVYGQVEYILTMQNYKDLFKPMYLEIFLYSLWIAFLTTIICLILGYPFAYFISNVKSKYKILFFMLIMIPFWTNSLVRTYAWMTILRTDGIINTYLIQLKIISQPLQLLYTNGAVLLGLVYTLFPFMVLPLYAAIEGLDRSYLEAASDLGASPIQAFLRVTLPLTMSGVAAGSVLVFIPTLGLFYIPDLLGGSKTMLISNLIQDQFLTARNWPFGSAISILLIIVTVISIILYFKKSSNKGLEVL
jgi:spermidine/putrescine transport system permease protein